MVRVPPVAVRLMLPLAGAPWVVMAPEVVRAPLLLTLTLEPAAVPFWLMPVMVSGPAVLFRLMPPLVLLLALNLATELALALNEVPVPEAVVSVPTVLRRPVPDSLMAPPAVRLMLAAVVVPAVRLIVCVVILRVPDRVTGPLTFTTSVPEPVLMVRLALLWALLALLIVMVSLPLGAEVSSTTVVLFQKAARSKPTPPLVPVTSRAGWVPPLR
jgi:hypothetical protein